MPGISGGSRQASACDLELAVSADDKIGAAGGKPVAITGEAAKARVHLLRAQCDAILVGIGTVLADDPLLTCRLPGMEARSPVRVVLDRALRLPGASRLVHSARETPLWVMTSDLAEAPAAMKLGAAGAQVMRIATVSRRRARSRGRAACAGRKGITRLMVEGGARVASSFVAADLADESGCCAARADRAGGIAALDALPLTAITQSPGFRFVLARPSIRTHLRSTSAPECLPALLPTSARLRPDADGAGPVAPAADRLPLRSHVIADGASIACNGVCLTVVASASRAARPVRRRRRRRNTRHDHGQALAGRHKAQSGASAEDRRRTRRSHRRRSCRRRPASCSATICPTWHGSS